MGRYIIIKQVTSDLYIPVMEDNKVKVYIDLEEANGIASTHLYSKVYDLKWDYSNYLTLFNNYAKACNHIKELEKLLHEKNAILSEHNLI